MKKVLLTHLFIFVLVLSSPSDGWTKKVDLPALVGDYLRFHKKGQIVDFKLLKKRKKKKKKYFSIELSGDKPQKFYIITVPKSRQNKVFPDFVTEDFLWKYIIDKKNTTNAFYGLKLEEVFYHKLSPTQYLLKHKLMYLSKDVDANSLTPDINREINFETLVSYQ
jgi:hypothetical protein